MERVYHPFHFYFVVIDMFCKLFKIINFSKCKLLQSGNN